MMTSACHHLTNNTECLACTCPLLTVSHLSCKLGLKRLATIVDAKIARLTPSDAQEYRDLMLQAFKRHPDAFTSSVSERSVEPLSWWESRLVTASRARQMVFGARVASSLVGVAGISFETGDKTRHKASVFGMYVDNTARGTGVAAQLLATLLEQACNRKATRIVQLTVTEGNSAALRLYEGVGGFSRFGIEPFAVRVGDSYVSKIHMWRNLANDA